MKKILLSLIAVTMLWTSCSDESIAPKSVSPSSNDDAASRKGKPTGTWTIVSSSIDGNTVTFTLDGANAQDASHILIQAVNCDGEIIAPTGDAFVNGSGVDYTGTTGSGTGCAFASGAFIKIDSDMLVGVGSTITVTVNFNEPIQGASAIVKFGTSCTSPLSISVNNCDSTPPACTEGETAWAGNTTYYNTNSNGNGGAWYSYFTVGTTVDLKAGQHNKVGTVSAAIVGAEIVFTVTLDAGITLEAGETDTWYAQSYVSAVTERPNSGTGMIHLDGTGTTFTGSIPYVAGNNYVAVHVNVAVPCVVED
jgi:hypothetical protein